MTFPRRRFLQAAASAAALPAFPIIARAQSYPSRPVHILVGYAAGGVNDVIARLTGQMLAERLGQSFVIEDRPGAGSNLATEAVIRANPDGYTLLEASTSNAWNATIYQHLSFDFIRDIAPVASTVRTYNVMEVHPSIHAKSVPEFIAYAKANPGKINMASAGQGSSPHLYGELFKALAGVDLVTVHYRGSGAALPDLLAGQCQVMFDFVVSSIEHIRSGRLRALAVTNATRTELPPTCRRSPILCPVSRVSAGRASARRETRRRTSSKNSTPRSMPALPSPNSRRGSVISARKRLLAPRLTSAGSSLTTPRNGPRSSARPM